MILTQSQDLQPVQRIESLSRRIWSCVLGGSCALESSFTTSRQKRQIAFCLLCNKDICEKNVLVKLCSCCNKQCIQKTNWNRAQCLKPSACKHSRHRSNYLLLYFSMMEILQKKKWNVWHWCIFGLHLFLRLLEKLIRSSSSLREGWGEDFLWLFTSQWQRFILSFPSSDHILVNLFTHQSLLSSPEHGRLTKWSFLCLSAGRKRRG